MIQRRGGFGFAFETLDGGGIVLRFRRKEFEGHEALQTEIFRLVDHSHSATAELLDDAVMRNDTPGHQRDALLYPVWRAC